MASHARVSRIAAARVMATLVLAGVCGVTSTVCAQQAIPKSQLASVTQQVAGARVEVVYRRPVARGRALFGALVPWGRIWTPSADSAARITISAPVTVNGAALAAGTYSIWTIPDSTSWTVVFNSTPAAFHLRYPAGTDVLRVQATPQQGPHVETLMFAFPTVDGDSAILHLHWGTTIVPLTLRVVPDASR
jgi:hypothetical protein